MAGIVEYAGQTDVSIGTTEWSLTTNTSGPDADTTDGVFQVALDLANLAAGDRFRLRLYERAISSSTQRVAAEWFFDGAQGLPIFISPSFILLHGWDFTLIRQAGSDRAITWSIRQVF